ncbi:MAG: hypothetical protein IJS52_09960 [Bacilli bacterium]|nr:hypothetical protein [Bacilli bacterium]
MANKPSPSAFIMVEGVSDVAFLSAYLGQIYGFRFERGSHKSDNIYSIDFYERVVKGTPSESLLARDETERIAIVSCDGHTSFDKAFAACVKPHFDNAPSDAKIRLLIIEDADQNESTKDSRYPSLEYSPKELFLDDTQGWSELSNGFGTTFRYKAILCCIPYDGEGCLETIVMDSVRGSEPCIVEESAAFIDGLSEEASAHIKKRRKRVKAKAGVVFTLLNPEGTFKELAEKFEKVDCTCEAIAKQFSFLQFLKANVQ